MDDATLLGELRATHRRVDEAMTRMENIHRENAVNHQATLGLIQQLDQKVDLRHAALQEQVDDVCTRTDATAAQLLQHTTEDTKRFGDIETRRQVTKARLGVFALLAGGGTLGLKEVLERFLQWLERT